MLDRIYMQMQAMQVLSRSQDVTADNLANINTPGFKGNKLFYRMMTENLNGTEIKRAVPMSQVNLDQGILEPTGNEFDVAINGEGFFKVQDGEQEYLTRDGRFSLNSDGILVNSNGAQVMGESGPIQLTQLFQSNSETGGQNQLEISKDGTILINGNAQDKIQIVKVDDPTVLERQGSTYFTVKDEIELSDEGTGMVMQGYFEKGNVEPLAEMVDMMRNMQMFESQQRALKTTDDMLSQVTSRLGRL
ncbi:MAG: flagellar hook-basal body protein [Balneolaceae bacterium]